MTKAKAKAPEEEAPAEQTDAADAEQEDAETGEQESNEQKIEAGQSPVSPDLEPGEVGSPPEEGDRCPAVNDVGEQCRNGQHGPSVLHDYPTPSAQAPIGGSTYGNK